MNGIVLIMKPTERDDGIVWEWQGFVVALVTI
jgi:hypothetical protein